MNFFVTSLTTVTLLLSYCHTSEVTEVTPVQTQQPGCIDNKIWRKKITDSMNF